MSINHLLNRTFNLWTSATTSDGAGGSSVTWTAAGTVPGRLSSASPSERQAASQEGVEISHVLYLAAGTAVARGNRLVDGDLAVEVVAVTVPSVASHHVKAIVKQEPWDEPLA